MNSTAAARPRPSRGLRTVFGATVLLLAVELLARFLSSSSERSAIVRGGTVGAALCARSDAIGAAGTGALVPDSELLWRNRPGTSCTSAVSPSPPGTSSTWTLRLDPSGFRGESAGSPDPSEGTFRILCVGDSVTLGFNVDQGSDYPSTLSRLLAERYPDRRFEVLNAGVPDWSWVQGSRFFLREGVGLHPHALVMAHGTADQQRASITDSERIWLSERTTSRPQGISRRLLDASSAWRLLAAWIAPPYDEGSDRSASPGCRVQEAMGSPCTRVSLPEIGATVQHVGAVTKTAGVSLLLASLDFSGSSSDGSVHRAAIRHGLAFVNSAERIEADRLHDEMVRSRDAGLAPPRVPFVPLGRIGLPATQGRGPRMRFRVTRVPSGKAVSVRGRGSDEAGFRFDQAMNDDGAGGDEKAGDGVYSAMVEVPTSETTLRYRFFSGPDPEFETAIAAAEPGTDRTIRFNRDGDAPIELFAARYLMSDDVHPNAEGHRRIAEDVLTELEKMPSFLRFVRGPAKGLDSPNVENER